MKQGIHPQLISIAESQNHRCACCGTRFETRLGLYSTHVFLIRLINDTDMRSYKNSVAVCPRCVGFRNKYKTIWSVYHALQSRFITPAYEKIGRPDNLDAFRDILVEMGCRDVAVNFFKDRGTGQGRSFNIHITRKSARQIENADPSQLPMIARNIVEIYRRYEGKERVLSYRYTKSSSNAKKRAWYRLFEEQHGRCHYDDYAMLDQYSFGKKIDPPRRATFEHLKRQCDGGSDHIENLVLACQVCNNLRGKLHMGVEDFRAWAMNNKHHIEFVANHGYHFWKKSFLKNSAGLKILTRLETTLYHER